MKIKISLKEIREKRCLTQKELAQKAGVSIGVITRIEQNIHKNVLFASMLKIAKALNSSVYDLIEIIED